MEENGDDLDIGRPKNNCRSIRLRRTRTAQPVLINKKKIAQEKYYAQKGQSPLIRSITALQESYKQPVHQRLGARRKKIILNRTRNNNMLPSTTPIRLKRNYNNSTKTIIRRRQTAQQRLIRIRQQNSLENLVQGLQSKKIRLRRQLAPTQATNLVVQVDNMSYRNEAFPAQFHHSVQNSLNGVIQNQIRVLQSQSNFNRDINIIPPQRIYIPESGATSVFLNDRFSSLP